MRKKKFSPVRIIFYLSALPDHLDDHHQPEISRRRPAEQPVFFSRPDLYGKLYQCDKKGGFAPIFSQQRRGYYHHYGAGHFVQQYGGLCSGKTAV